MSKINRKFFFDSVRLRLFDGSLRQTHVDGLTAFLDYWEDSHSEKDDRWLAYVLGTAHHEVGRTMQPIRERGGRKYFHEMYDIKGNRPQVAKRLGNFSEGDGERFHGRGFVQLTGRYNYAYWQDRLNVDLTSSYKAADRVMELDVAMKIIFEGMIVGSFTGKKLEDYFVNVREDWRNARRIVNGLDRAELVASYAKLYYASISYTT